MNIAGIIEGVIAEIHAIKEKPSTEEEKKQKLKDMAKDLIAILEAVVG